MDTLGIVLREQVDVVDKFFLGRISMIIFIVVNCSFSVEANFTHKGVKMHIKKDEKVNE